MVQGDHHEVPADHREVPADLRMVPGDPRDVLADHRRRLGWTTRTVYHGGRAASEGAGAPAEAPPGLSAHLRWGRASAGGPRAPSRAADGRGEARDTAGPPAPTDYRLLSSLEFSSSAAFTGDESGDCQYNDLKSSRSPITVGWRISCRYDLIVNPRLGYDSRTCRSSRSRAAVRTGYLASPGPHITAPCP